MTVLPITLALPCRLIRLDLLVGPAGGVTALEDLVARGILAAQERERLDDGTEPVATTDYLAGLFEISDRVIIDVISSLWSKGYVAVDFDSGEVDLSPEARERLSKKESLAADGELETKEFLFEPITGMILPERWGRSRAAESSVPLPLRAGLRESDIPQADLVRSVQAAWRSERSRTGVRNVLHVGFGSPALRAPVSISWLKVEVAARIDPESDRLSVTVNEQAAWPASAQQRLSDFIAALADDEPLHPVATQLRSRAHRELKPTGGLDELLRRMGTAVAELASFEPSQVPERHRVLSSQASSIRQQLERMRGTLAQVTPISHDRGHAWAVDDLIANAQSQLLFSVPSLDYNRFRELLPGLRKAVDRGVQLVLLWGRLPSDTLPEKAGTALDELELRPGARVLRAPRSVQTEACLLVADGNRALVSSHSMVGSPPPGGQESAVLIEPVEGGAASPAAVVELLEWARTEFPRWSLGQRIELPAEETPTVPASQGEAWDNAEFNRNVMDEGAVRLWADRWAAIHGSFVETRAQIVAKAATAEVVKDGAHRTALWDGLRSAKRRLVLADDRIDARTANASLVRAIRDRAESGVSVDLIHPELPAADRGPESIASLRTGPNRVPVRLGRDAGRVIIADGEVLLGSYSPLGEGRGGVTGPRISQLGLRIRSEQLAAELADLLGAAPAAAPEPGVGPPPERVGGAERALPLLLEARTLAGDDDFGRLAASRLRTMADPYQVLDTWRATGVPDAELRAAAAALLSETQPGAERVSGETEWLGWLVEDAWRREAFVEAALISERLTGRPGLPLRAVATLATALEVGPLGSLVEDVALALAVECEESPETVGAATAGAAGALAELLLWGGEEGRSAVDMLLPALSPTWRECCERVRAMKSLPIPLAALTENQTRAEALHDLEVRREKLITEIDKLEALRTRFDFNTGTTLHRRLFLSGGLLSTIREAARAGDDACCQLAHDDLPPDVRVHLNRVIADADENPMEWLKQTRFLQRIEDIVRSVRAIGIAVDVGRLGRDVLDRRPAADVIELGEFLADRWPALFTEANQLKSPYGLPPLALLNILNPLLTWVTERS